MSNAGGKCDWLSGFMIQSTFLVAKCVNILIALVSTYTHIYIYVDVGVDLKNIGLIWTDCINIWILRRRVVYFVERTRMCAFVRHASTDRLVIFPQRNNNKLRKYRVSI